MADVKCGLYEINKTSGANATQEMFQDQTKAMLDRRGLGPGPGPVLTLLAAITMASSRLKTGKWIYK